MPQLNEKLNLKLDCDEYNKRIVLHKNAIVENFYDETTGDFCENSFAANAFAIDVGLGDIKGSMMVSFGKIQSA